MLTREDAVAAGLTFPFSYRDAPFGDENWTVVRHRENDRIFLMIFEREGRIWLNLKANPQWAEVWRAAYPAVRPAYHMNKKHWISVILDGSIPEEELLRLIGDSFTLTAKRTGRPSRAEG